MVAEIRTLAFAGSMGGGLTDDQVQRLVDLGREAERGGYIADAAA